MFPSNYSSLFAHLILDGSAEIGPELPTIPEIPEPNSDLTDANDTQETNVEDSDREEGLDYDNEDYDKSSEEEDKI